MKQEQVRQLATLTGAVEFLDAHSDVFGSISASDTRKRLETIIAQVQDNAKVQLARGRTLRGSTEGRVQLEDELRHGHMMPIAEFARVQVTDAGELKALTPSASDLKGARLVHAARGMAEAAQGHIEDLIAAHFPADVVTQLTAAADAVQARLDRRIAVAREHAGATKDIASGLAEGRAIVRKFGTVVKRTARRNPGLLAEWRAAQRVKLKPGVVDKDVPAPVPVLVPAVSAGAAGVHQDSKAA